MKPEYNNESTFTGNQPLPPLDPRGTFRLTLDEGGPGFAQFAVTNICNAVCGFCSFAKGTLPRESIVFPDVARSIEAIDILYKNSIRYLVLTGGETLLYPHLIPVVKRACQLGMNVLAVTNGALLNQKRITALSEAELSGLIISIDAADVALHEQNRGLPGVCATIRQANDIAREAGIETTASVTMSRLVDYDRLPGFLESLGFNAVTFSYPLRNLNSSFLGHAESDLIDLSDSELLTAFDNVIAMKKRFRVLNPTRSLEEMKRFVRNEPQQYPCLGGYRYFYMDWNLDLWRCHFWEKPQCSVFEFDETKLVRDNCTRCMIDCYRDASLMHAIGITLSDSWQALKRGKMLAAVEPLLRKQNIASLHALCEEIPLLLSQGLSSRKKRG